MLAVIVAVYNGHVFWTISLYRSDEGWKCDAADDNYFMMHVFEYLKLVSYCVVPSVVVVVLNVSIVVRLRQSSPLQYSESVSVASLTPRRTSSRRYFFARRSLERSSARNVDHETAAASDVLVSNDNARSPARTASRHEVMFDDSTCVSPSHCLVDLLLLRKTLKPSLHDTAGCQTG